MWVQFFWENIHFAINLLAALVMFGIFWLYWDAWLMKKEKNTLIRIVGFVFLSISFLLHAIYIETTVLAAPILSNDLNIFLVSLTRISGYVLVLISLIQEPLEERPKLDKMISGLPVLFSQIVHGLPVFYPILAVSIGFLYLRRATVGLENHVKKIALSFFLLSFAELLSLSALLEGTGNVNLYNLVVPFAPLWIIQHLLELIAIIILLIWVFGYLLKRFQSQLFMIFTTTIVALFLLTTTTFTGLLLKNLQDEALVRLKTDVKVLNYTLESQKSQILSDAQVLAQNPLLLSEFEETGGKNLSDLAENFLLNKKEGILTIINENGQVIARGEDRERKGDSVSDDPLVKRSLVGESSTSVVTKDGVLAPEISVRAAVPIKKEGKIIGAVMAGITIDNAFVEGMKRATGLEASLYGDNRLSATTLLATDGKSRPLGIKEENNGVKTHVLQKGEEYATSLSLLGRPYFAAYLPLKDVDNNIIGMLFVGRPQETVLQSAGRSIEATFIVAVLLLVASIIPAYLISKNIADQIK